MQKLLSKILFLAGIVAVVVMLLTFKVSFAVLWDYIHRAGYWLAAAVLLWGALYCLNALTLRIIIRGSGSCPVGFLRLWQITVSGFALNTTVPVGGIGGEPYRIMELSRYIGVERATSSVVLFAMTHVFSHFWFWLTGILVYVVLWMTGLLPLPEAMRWMMGLAVLLCLSGIWLFARGYKYGLVCKVIRLSGRVPGLRSWSRRFEDNHRESLQRIDRQIAQLHDQNRRAFLQSFFLEYVGRILQSLEVFFILMLFGFGAGQTPAGYIYVFCVACLILVFTSLFANLIGFVPLQLGGREGGFALSVAALGMTAELGLFIGIICRVREIIWACIGLLMMKLSETINSHLEQDIKQTYKSNDTEEWLDRVFTRPIGYLWAIFFQRLGIHPNVVTVPGILIGITSAFFFKHGSWRTEDGTGLLLNVVGILLMMWANFYDSADGQLARMTGKKTQLGRILDGAAGIIIFVPVYCAMVWRCYQHHTLEFQWLGIDDTELHAAVYGLMLFGVCLFSGFVCHSGQCRLSDYYRQIHLFFLKAGDGSEFSTSVHQQRLYDAMPWRGHLIEKAFLATYVNYIRQQEKSTPAFQRMMLALRTKYGAEGRAPQSFRDEFRRCSLPLMPLTNILTFNTRAIALYFCCLIDLPWLYFVFETVVMSALCEYMRRRHESLCDSISV